MPGDIARRLKALERRHGSGLRRTIHDFTDGELLAAIGLRNGAGRLKFDLSDDELHEIARAA